MSTVELPSTGHRWPTALPDAWTPSTLSWGRRNRRVEHLLPLLTGVCLVVTDLGLVVGAFMLAHWLRFIAADDTLAALGLDRYVLMASVVGLLTCGLFAFRGLYDAPRSYAWPTRLY